MGPRGKTIIVTAGCYLHLRSLVAARYFYSSRRGVYEISVRKSIILRTDRPTTSHLGKLQMAIYPRGVVRSTSRLVLRWGFRDRMALFPVSPNPRWRRSRHLEKFKWRYNANPMGVSGSADRMALFRLTKFNRYAGRKQCARSNQIGQNLKYVLFSL